MRENWWEKNRWEKTFWETNWWEKNLRRSVGSILIWEGAMAKQRRGPLRSLQSSRKVACAFKQCRSGRCCKNVGRDLQLRRSETDLSRCRPVRAHCGMIKFCCPAHVRTCRLGAISGKAKSATGREPMDLPQVQYLCEGLLREGRAWAVVAVLLQLFLGERCAAALHAQFSWFRNCSPGSQGTPVVVVPRVNKKTVAREVPLPLHFAELLHGWIHNCPLKANTCGDQWPFHGHPCSGDNYLFPGQTSAGEKLWNRPISTRAYAKVLARMATLISAERSEARAAGKVHVFDSFNLERLGSHSLKKTAVCALKDRQCSTSLITALTGTSGRTLDRTYDQATPKRVRVAVSTVLLEAMPTSFANDAPLAIPKFCSQCGNERVSKSWVFCPSCGHAFSTK